MTEYSNENRGAIWKNDKMREGKQDPEFTGSLNVDGREFWVSAWRKKPDAKPSAPSLSFSLRAKDEQRQPNPGLSEPADTDVPYDDEIPF